MPSPPSCSGSPAITPWRTSATIECSACSAPAVDPARPRAAVRARGRGARHQGRDRSGLRSGVPCALRRAASSRRGSCSHARSSAARSRRTRTLRSCSTCSTAPATTGSYTATPRSRPLRAGRRRHHARGRDLIAAQSVSATRGRTGTRRGTTRPRSRYQAQTPSAASCSASITAAASRWSSDAPRPKRRTSGCAYEG